MNSVKKNEWISERFPDPNIRPMAAKVIDEILSRHKRRMNMQYNIFIILNLV